jgi:hypothetical protein
LDFFFPSGSFLEQFIVGALISDAYFHGSSSQSFFFFEQVALKYLGPNVCRVFATTSAHRTVPHDPLLHQFPKKKIHLVWWEKELAHLSKKERRLKAALMIYAAWNIYMEDEKQKDL